jgi:hypothetical protein
MRRVVLGALAVLLFSSLRAQTDPWDKFPGYPDGCWRERDDWQAKYRAAAASLEDAARAQDALNRDQLDKLGGDPKPDAARAKQQSGTAEISNTTSSQQRAEALMAEAGTERARLEKAGADLEAGYNAAMEETLGPIRDQLAGLGDSSQDRATRKELAAQYRQAYEAICADYFAGPGSKFRLYLAEYRRYLETLEIPGGDASELVRAEAAGVASCRPTAGLRAVSAYAELCNRIFLLRAAAPIAP